MVATTEPLEVELGWLRCVGELLQAAYERQHLHHVFQLFGGVFRLRGAVSGVHLAPAYQGHLSHLPYEWKCLNKRQHHPRCLVLVEELD
jgi:hypothetical protein